MKHFYILTTAITSVFITQSIAQTITATGSNPVIGETFNYKTTSYFGPGTSGTGQTWNFSTISGASTTSNVVSVSSTPNGSSFPNANVALTGAGSTYSYQKTSATVLQNYGFVGSGVVIAYSNPEDLLRYPFSFSNTFSDTWAAIFTNGGYTFYRNGSSTITADGTGTLITPTATFTGVLRVHLVENYSDSVNIFGTPTVTTYNNDQYLWYKDGIHYPLASCYSLTTGAGTTTGGSYYVSTSVGIEENLALANSINLFPNPTSENIRLKYNIESTTSVKISIINILGQEVYAEEISKLSAGEQTIDLNVSSFEKGTYFVKIQTNDSFATKKIIVQ